MEETNVVNDLFLDFYSIELINVWRVFSGSFGVKMAKLTTDRRFSVGDALQERQEVLLAETALLSLGDIAIASEQVENEVTTFNYPNGVLKIDFHNFIIESSNNKYGWKLIIEIFEWKNW